MIAAIVILTVGLADIAVELSQLFAKPQRATTRVPVTVALIVASAVVIAIAVISTFGLGLPVAATVALALFGLLWVAAASLSRWAGRNVPLLVAALALVAAVVAGLALSPALHLKGPLISAFASFSAGAGFGYSLQLTIGAIGVVLFLTQSMNNICKAALGRALASEPTTEVDPTPNRWDLILRGRTVATVEKGALAAPAHSSGGSPVAARSGLRGGRVIGPIERLAIAVLALFGAQPVIVGLLAAKGIVRFPEIAADGRGGSRAEEFLVGSLVSWSSAGLAALLILVLRNS